MTHETVMILRRTGTSAFQDLQQHPQHREYEISSLTKTFTALLLADAIRRGEVTADTKASPLLPLGDIPLAEVTLAGLASHRSGLSAQGMQADTIPFAPPFLSHREPFTQDVDGVLAI